MTSYIIEIGDAWLSCSSIQIAAIAETLEQAVTMIAEREDLSDEQRTGLKEQRQTFGLDNNYLIEEMETGDWLD